MVDGILRYDKLQHSLDQLRLLCDVSESDGTTTCSNCVLPTLDFSGTRERVFQCFSHSASIRFVCS